MKYIYGFCIQIIISNNSKEPIYEQIYLQIKKLILTGELKKGQSLPSMRQLEKNLDISVITTKRAYEELEKKGFIYSIVILFVILLKIFQDSIPRITEPITNTVVLVGFVILAIVVGISQLTRSSD